MFQSVQLIDPHIINIYNRWPSTNCQGSLLNGSGDFLLDFYSTQNLAYENLSPSANNLRRIGQSWQPPLSHFFWVLDLLT